MLEKEEYITFVETVSRLPDHIQWVFSSHGLTQIN